jgi:hypothetical protein
VKPIIYDHILERYRAAWDKQADDWNALGVGSGFVEAVKSFMQGNKDEAFFWTHLVDVALYMATTVRTAVQTSVARQIVDVIVETTGKAEWDGWSVIAHSLGTAVTHHALDRLGELSERAADFDAVGAPPPRAVCMAANVARVCTYPKDEGRLYAGKLSPIGPPNPNWYLSCRHRLDPFMIVKPFNASGDDWAPPAFADLSGLDVYYLADELLDWLGNPDDGEKFAAIVPHGFEHYMRQPAVAAVLWPRLLSERQSEFGPKIAAAVAEKYVGQRNDKLRELAVNKLERALPSFDAGDTALDGLRKALSLLLLPLGDD